MFLILQVLTVSLVAVAVALSLAHALEMPGKKRLDKAAYLATQPIYYPGFTIGGALGEAGGMIALIVLVLLTGPGGRAFPWTLVALVMFLAAHGAYWVFTHPINKFWLRDQKLAGPGGAFFAFDPARRAAPEGKGGDDWTHLRDRWERSHVVRAVLFGLSFVCLVIAVAL